LELRGGEMKGFVKIAKVQNGGWPYCVVEENNGLRIEKKIGRGTVTKMVSFESESAYVSSDQNRQIENERIR
jgi:hypothetical protein